jgi:hypothetical protein
METRIHLKKNDFLRVFPERAARWRGSAGGRGLTARG